MIDPKLSRNSLKPEVIDDIEMSFSISILYFIKDKFFYQMIFIICNFLWLENCKIFGEYLYDDDCSAIWGFFFTFQNTS